MPAGVPARVRSRPAQLLTLPSASWSRHHHDPRGEGMRLDSPGSPISPTCDRRRSAVMTEAAVHSGTHWGTATAATRKFRPGTRLCAPSHSARRSDTEFADMRTAWDMLAPALQGRSGPCTSTAAYSQGRLGFPSPNRVARFAPVRQRSRASISQRRHSLYLSSHAAASSVALPRAMMMRELTSRGPAGFVFATRRVCDSSCGTPGHHARAASRRRPNIPATAPYHAQLRQPGGVA